MHTTHSNTQYKNESSTVKWAQWDKTQSRQLLVCSYVCALHCAQLLHKILHRTDLIVFQLTLQSITTSPMMSIWGKWGWVKLSPSVFGDQTSQLYTAEDKQYVLMRWTASISCPLCPTTFKTVQSYLQCVPHQGPQRHPHRTAVLTRFEYIGR